MSLEVVFTSSYSSQLGAILCLSKYFSEKDSINKNKNILVFHISSKGDKKCSYSCLRDFSKVLLGEEHKIKIIKINNILKRFILFLSLNIFKISLIKKKINVWEPSPSWIYKLFTFRSLDLNLFKFYFKNIRYYGDGFLCLSQSNSPFWLVQDKRSPTDAEYLGIFYYFYEILSAKNKKSSYIKLNSSYIKRELKKISNSFIKNKNINSDYLLKNLIIFPLTTFSETSRSSLEQEINLYIEYLKKNVSKSKSVILIKPHPGGITKKTEILIKKLKSQEYNLVNNEIESILNLPLNILPLEMLCLLLVYNFKLKLKDITITVNSNASLSTYFLYPEINYIKPFGKELISKYLKKTFSKQRLIQEEILVKNINEK